MNETYNGWTNWETWNFMLWEGDYLQERYEEELKAVDCLDYEDDSQEMKEANLQTAYYIIENHIEYLLDEALTNRSGFEEDLITHGYNLINKDEIARHLIED